jgi:hypothetical protein
MRDDFAPARDLDLSGGAIGRRSSSSDTLQRRALKTIVWRIRGAGSLI